MSDSISDPEVRSFDRKGSSLSNMSRLMSLKFFSGSIMRPLYTPAHLLQARYSRARPLEDFRLQKSLQAHFLKRLSQADEPRTSEKSADFYATVQKVVPKKIFVIHYYLC